MKSKLSKGLLAALLIVLGLLVPIAPAFGSSFAGGDGSAGNPFQITNWHHLNNVRNHLGSHFILMNNLDSGTTGYAEWASSTAHGGLGWLPIGTDAARFTGTFDGAGFAVRNLSINRPTTDFIGLFGFIENATVSDFRLENVNIQGRSQTGGLVGQAVNSTIEKVYVTGWVASPGVVIDGRLIHLGDNIGGLVGQAVNSRIENANVTGEVRGRHSTGGLVGQLYSGSLHYAYSDSSVRGTGSNTGGLVGSTGSSLAGVEIRHTYAWK
jgi:hypothetical protein